MVSRPAFVDVEQVQQRIDEGVNSRQGRATMRIGKAALAASFTVILRSAPLRASRRVETPLRGSSG
ncbi:hypothetical protein [Bradyrhizobium tropiciagri]|uniref:hypothetical protein n=1 Tax=Bradyrhizobium tropiciagri TaxID=312253 RepID=UPI00067D0B0D|nr:hypothetical protein [Bradyrhizobium tropiciagri]